MPPVISVEHLSKVYRLGQIGTGTFTNDLKVWWARARGKPNPLLKIGEVDHGNRAGEELWALRDVSFAVEQGEVLGVIGRNGAGKSTLLKILSRVTAPTSGRVRVKGRIASLLEVGTGFHPELTGRENIYLNGAILGMKRAEIDRKFDEIVDFAEIEQFIDTPVKRYSSGMYVRLAFAVAAHLESEILLVDEVLAVGDAEFQKKCLGKMGDVATQEGRTVLFVSHNLNAIEGICNKCYWFDIGELREKGNPNETISKYLKENNKGYHAKVLSNDLKFMGILNREELNRLRITDDICFSIGFRSGREELDDIGIDIALLNAKNEWVIHLRSTFIAHKLKISPNKSFSARYRIFSPNLSPGPYEMILYVYSIKTGKPILWLEGIDACNISPKIDGIFPYINYIDQIRSTTLPNYSLEVDQDAELSK